ncbi:MAG: hypothetical protein MK185_06725 [Saccharospirillaceae bacterium]|nr:hypothetical protein [Saccharospirillaceae bacterium]
MKKLLLISSIAVALSGCIEPPAYDATSDITKIESLSKLKEGLSPADADRIDKAIKYYKAGGLIGHQIKLADMLESLGVEKPEGEPLSLLNLHGKTAEQILADFANEEAKTEAFQKEFEDRQKKRDEFMKLANEARKLEREEKYAEAITTYESLAKQTEGTEGVDYATDRINKLKSKIREATERKSYRQKVKIVEFTAKRIDTYSKKDLPAVRFSIKNEGDKTLDKVEVTVKYNDKDGKPIHEETYLPVLVNDYTIGAAPLKPGYIEEMEDGKYYTLKSKLKAWDEGNADIAVTDIRFSQVN